ncbi:acetyltransferase (GNAT) family protein [Idiomarina fontislapidosi]|uniref:GNAT family N-acetyltransferase n=1 Tax=Idiomarina fontislapidosi TaxID=263723 RepID=A0A432XIR1_9GAMM|nr:GNAT family N-acetyltransferase [Idiomarina fontislapidosi]PYE30183.1 acetyltransferase (GNAT) family protein [Idiomarina fontislapidosi]RUO48623.1 GNAT family N-acetyltransferase [Idiomarina fontislapidosi]
MNITYTQGTVADIIEIDAAVPEFDNKNSKEKIEQRLAGKETLILVALEGAKKVGYKLGYALSDTEFYSWLGAVHPSYRGHGIAKQLLKQQEAWVKSKGFKSIRVKSMKKFPAMLQLLISQGYVICGYDDKGSPEASKIHFIKG